MPICQNCGVRIPEDRNQCQQCGTAVAIEVYPYQASFQSDLDSTKQTPGYTISNINLIPGVKLGKWDKRWVACALGAVMFIVGIFLTDFFASLFYFEPLIGLIFGYLTIICPLMGILLIAIGHFKPGGIILIIGSVVMVPIGLIGIYGGVIALRLKTARTKINEHKSLLDPKFINPLKKPNNAFTILGVICILICLIFPGMVYANYVNQPQLKIDDVITPSFSSGSSVDITVKLLNVGLEDANGSAIKIRFLLSGSTQKFAWQAGDIKSRNSVEDVFTVDFDRNTNLEEVSVYYKGELSHTVYYERM